MTPRLLRALDDGEAARRWDEFREVAPDCGAHRERLAPIFDLSPFLFECALAHPADAMAAADGHMDDVFEDICTLPDPEGRAEGMMGLRVAKRRAALVAGVADLLRLWPTMTVTRALTRFADAAVTRALAIAERALIDRGRKNAPGGIAVIAMGKYGAGELNYSSDIDLVVVFDPDDASFPDRNDALDVAVRVTRDMVAILQDRTAHGYVFRTDLRLRPDPGSMPLAISLAMAERYYESRGQNWERAAFIKARHCAGDARVSAEMLRDLVPFRWRRYLDFAAIADIHSIKRQIQSHKDILGLEIPGHNVKLGRGGIREIEFFVQTQQLIAGGRDPVLRGRRTLRMLDALCRAGWIEERTRDELHEAYLALRDVEHRIQMVRDAQEHSLPTEPNELLRVARLNGFDRVAEFERWLLEHLRRVEHHYTTLFEDEETLAEEGSLSFTGDDPDPDTVETLHAMGFARPRDMIAVVRGWHYGRTRAMASAKAREELTAMVPMLLREFARTGRPDDALLAFDAFLGGLPAGIQLFALLRANPDLSRLLIDILGAAPRLAAIVSRRPHVVDGLIEPHFFDTLPDAATLHGDLSRFLSTAPDYETVLDRLRSCAAEQRFLIGVRLLGGAVSPQRAGEAYTLLAETVLALAIERVGAEMERRYGVLEGWRLAVMGMGRLGSKELTAGSDLDLIVLYDAPEGSRSTGRKTLDPSEYAIRFVQTLMAAMSAPTSQGVAYELDFRLRPSGNAGPLATTLKAFHKHQTGKAHVWEHLALTRARVVSGDAELAHEATVLIDDVAGMARDWATTAAEVREMRALIDAERPPNGPFDVKLVPGGLIDLEFIAQHAVLVGRVERDPSVQTMLSALDANGDHGLAEAHSLYTSVAQLTRVALEGPLDADAPDGFVARLLRETGDPSLDALRERLGSQQEKVRRAFDHFVR